MATSYEGFYEGGVSSFNPDYGNFTGYRMSAASLGFPGSPQTANQLGEAVNAAKQGAKAFEVELLMAETAEAVPKQHFEEMRALMKLTGVKPSVHGPMIDAAGFDEKGNWGNGFGRQDAERRMFDTMEKAAMLDNKGAVPVVFHSSAGAPGAEFRPGKEEWGEEKEVMQRGAAINRETGQAIQLKREYKFRPEAPEFLEEGVDYKRDSSGEVMVDSAGQPIMKEYKGRPGGVLFDAKRSVRSANLGEWENKLTEVAQMNKHAGEIMGAAALNLPEYENAFINERGKIYGVTEDGKRLKEIQGFDEKTGQAVSYEQLRKADLFLDNADLSFKGAFHQAYKYGSPEQKKELKELSNDYSKTMRSMGEAMTKEGPATSIWNPVHKQKTIDDSLRRLRDITERGGTPQVFQESNAFALDKAAETFGNLAKRSYDNLGGDKAPVLAIEPFHPGAALSSTDDMIKLVKKSRKNFAKQLVDDQGVGKGEAKKIAEEKIGVTWDVGHINMIRKYGFSEKDVVEQTKKIAPMVKHVHLTDNFGFADSHLAPGMGNTPIKKIMEELEKTGRLDEMRKITEAGAFVQHFKQSPHPLTLAAFGSPIYGMTAGAGWNQAHQVQGVYSGGYGTLNPQTHHSYFGAGFTTMPVELGGNMPGGESRFGGTPMN